MTASVLGMTYGMMLVVFLAVDLLWLGVVARRFYLNHLGRFLAEQVNWAAAFVFYLLFLAGMMIFAVQPALEQNSLSRALALGALYGLFTYATYDLTNLATLKEWPVPIVVVDILWGMILSGLVSATGFLAATRLF
jgi:uncharacterized membrane protein